jgi:hypothetical protein
MSLAAAVNFSTCPGRIFSFQTLAYMCTSKRARVKDGVADIPFGSSNKNREAASEPQSIQEPERSRRLANTPNRLGQIKEQVNASGNFRSDHSRRRKA